MKLSRNTAPDRWKRVIFVFLVVLQLSSCAKVKPKSSASATDLSLVNLNGKNPANISSEVNNTAISLNAKENRFNIANLTSKASTKNGLTISKTAFRLMHRLSKDFIIPSVTNLLNPGNGNSLSKRSHDSTFALIAFVTFSTFVLFTLLPLLTYPRRQRIARGYINRFRAKNKLKPLSLHFYKPAKLSRYKKMKPDGDDAVSYAAVAVPIESAGGKGNGLGYGGGGDGGKSQQQEDFESDVNDLWGSREPQNGPKPYGLGPGGDIASGIKTYTIGGNPGSQPNSFGGGWSPHENQKPIHLSTITDSDNEYLTKDEIMYLLKTL